MNYQSTHPVTSFTLKNSPYGTVEGGAALGLMDMAYETDATVKQHSDNFQMLERHYDHITNDRHPNLKQAASPENSTVIADLKQKMATQEIPRPSFNISHGDQAAFRALSPQESNHFVAGMQLEIDEAHKKLDTTLVVFEEKFFASEAGKNLQSFLQSAAGDYNTARQFLQKSQQDIKSSAAQIETTATKAETGMAGKAKELLSDVKKMSGGKKFAIAAAATAIVAVIGGWVWKSKHGGKEKSTEQEQGAAR